MENRNKKGQFVSKQQQLKKNMLPNVKPLQDKNTFPQKIKNGKAPHGEGPSKAVMTDPVNGKSTQSSASKMKKEMKEEGSFDSVNGKSTESSASKAVKIEMKENENCPTPCIVKSSELIESTHTEGSIQSTQNEGSIQSTQNEERTRPVHIVATKPQEQLTMRERLALWKQEKQKKKEMELQAKGKISNKRPMHSAPNSTRKTFGPQQTSNTKLDRRATFSVRTGANTLNGAVKSEMKRNPVTKLDGGATFSVRTGANTLSGAVRSETKRNPVTKLDRRATFSVKTGANTLTGAIKAEMKRPAITEPKHSENKKPRVSVKKPVLIITKRPNNASKQATQQPWGKSQRQGIIRRQSAVTRRRLSAGMSKRPVGILKRKSCVPAIGSSSSGTEAVISTEGPKFVEHTHVKFLTPSQTPSENHPAYRKTPSKSKDSQSSQDSMRHKLNCWLEAKGKTPSKFRHLMCFDAAMSERKKKDSQQTRSITVKQLSEQQKKMATEDSVCQNLLSQFNAVAKVDKEDKKQKEIGISEQLDALLKECNQLIETGCPTDTIIIWLNNIYDNITLARYYTPYYRCKVQAVKKCGSHSDVIQVLSQAIANSAQPPSELAELNACVIKEMLSQASVPALIIDTAEHNTDMESTTGVKEHRPSLCQQSELGDVERGGSVKEEQVQQKVEPAKQDEGTGTPFVVQYSVTNVTPFKKRKRATSLCTQNTQTIVTPVRRSTRRSVQGNITDSEKIVKSITDLSEVEKNSALYRPNHALDDVLKKYQ